MKLWSHLFGSRSKREKRYSVDDYMSWFTYNGIQYPIVGAGGSTQNYEKVENSFVGYVRSAYKSNGIVFACMLARSMIFSEARFLWQDMPNGQPGALSWTRELEVLDKPWPNGSTGELLARMIQDVDLAGNFYAVREAKRMRRLRPDWVEIILTAPPSEAVESDVAGYMYRPGGTGTPTFYLPEQIVHWSPIPDPEAQYRGMSWLTPVIRELQADGYATDHKLKFFTNGAQLGTVLSLKESVTPAQFGEFVKMFKAAHQGTENAYEPLVVGGGADVTVVGADLKSVDFKAIQGAGETRIAADSGIHPVILGFSEGLAGSSLNAGNFNSARRLTANKTMRPLWRSGCAAISNVMKVPRRKRLWFDDNIAFLLDDQMDRAVVQSKEAYTIRNLVDGGWDPESVKEAVSNHNWALLKHTGKLSVQLQEADIDDDPDNPDNEPEPGTDPNEPDEPEDDTPAEGDED